MKKAEQINNSDIVNFLLEQKAISESRAAELKKIKKTADIFKELATDLSVDQEVLAKLKARFYGLKYADLSGIEIKREVVSFLPKEIAQNYGLVVFEKDNGLIKAAMSAPLNLKGQEAVEFLAREKKVKVEYYLVSPRSFKSVFKAYSALEAEVGKALGAAEDKMEQRKKELEKIEEGDFKNVEEVIKSAPISKMIDVIVRHGVEMKASDIHIEPFVDQSRVRYRIDGILYTKLLLPKSVHAALVSRVKVMANLKIDETRVPQDGRIRLSVDKNNVDFRISTLPLYEQEKVVMRILDTSSGTLTFEQLGFQGKNLEFIQNNIDKPNGMFLVTGPTGSGKSTTLYSVLSILNKEGVNIVTLEDPVEYYLKGVNQSQINPEVGLTFAAGLRSILRQDPDVVMVGEIRDSETAELAIHAALTGHFVLSTLHTNDSFGAIPRLLDMGVEGFLLTSTLNIVIAQRLVRKICSKCKQQVQIPEKTVDFVWKEYKNIPKEFVFAEISGLEKKEDMVFYHGKGCHHCNSTGYGGRLAVAEVLDMSPKLKSMIASSASLEDIKTQVLSTQMATLQQDGIMKAIAGETTIEEIMRVTKE